MRLTTQADIGKRLRRMGNLEVVRLLLDRGPGMPVSDGGLMALHSASIGNHVEIRCILLDQRMDFEWVGVNIDSVSNRNGTALSCAARNGHMEMLQMLVESGADLRFQSTGRISGLGGAASEGQVEAVRVLLEP